MFATAFWDAGRRELLLARDRAGKKPLYYAALPGLFVFASEVRALLASGLIPRRLSAEALDVYLANGFVVGPGTLVEGVRALMPGHWMRLTSDARPLEITSYWRPGGLRREEARGRGPELDSLRDCFREAVTQRLIADVPVAVFLSGGMDSSAIALAIHEAGYSPMTFTVGVDDESLDESAPARSLAQRISARHHEVKITAEQVAQWLPDAVAAQDQPSFDGVNTFCVARAARQAGLKVAISGLGADELFGGYPFLRWTAWMSRLARVAPWLPAPWAGAIVRSLEGRNGPPPLGAPWKALDLMRSPSGGETGSFDSLLAGYQVTQIVFPSWARRRLLPLLTGADNGTAVWQALGLPASFVAFLRTQIPESDPDPGDFFTIATMRLFLGERCLRDTDSMAMASSLEVRAPFTDHRFVEEALRFPGRLRCASPPEKRFERRLMGPILDGAWSPRPKQGFIMPFTRWLRAKEGERMLRESLSDHSVLVRAGLRPESVHEILRGHLENPRRVPWSRVWALFVLVEWIRRHGMSL